MMTNRVERTAIIRIYEWNGEDKPIGQTIDKLVVKSHWNRSDMIVIHAAGCPEFTIVADDLMKAIRSTNDET